MTEAQICGMIRDVATGRPEAITVFCTNLRGAGIVTAMEEETGIPIYDAVATAAWASLRAAGVDPRRIEGRGRLFTVGAG